MPTTTEHRSVAVLPQIREREPVAVNRAQALDERAALSMVDEIYAAVFDEREVAVPASGLAGRTSDFARRAFGLEEAHGALAAGRDIRNTAARSAQFAKHVARAARLRRSVEVAQQRNASVMHVVDQLPFGIVLVDEYGRIIRASAAAAAILRAGDGLESNEGAVRACRKADDRLLQQALQRSLRRCDDPRHLASTTVTVHRSDRRRRLTVTVMPVAPDKLVMSTPAACMLAIFDPESSLRPTPTVVERLLNLTAAEARLACALFSGIKLCDVARQLELSINTCKAQLKSVYDKTGCRNRVELAKAVLFAASAASSEKTRLGDPP